MHNDELEDEADNVSRLSERREKERKEPGGVELSRTTALLNEVLNLKLTDLDANGIDIMNSPMS